MLLPEGSLSKNIKGVFGLIIVLVIVQPLISLKNGEINLDFSFSETKIVFQEDYIYYISEKKVDNLQKSCEKILEEKGIKDSEISIDYSTSENGQVQIIKVNIDLEKAVIISNEKHIDIIEDIVTPVCEYLSLDSKLVQVNE